MLSPRRSPSTLSFIAPVSPQAAPRPRASPPSAPPLVAQVSPQQMSLERITLHSLQGKILVQVLISMPPEMLISEAVDIAKRAEKEILAAMSAINQVSIQLRLGRPIQSITNQ